MRYSVPPSAWVQLPYESPDMLSYLLRKIPEISKLNVTDAYFIHSEEHSKRLVTVIHYDRTHELPGRASGTHVEKREVEWVIKSMPCLECTRIASNQTWSSVVQVRQKSKSKKALLLLEQSILKAGLHDETTDIKGVQDGIDFFYNAKTPALKLVRYIEEQFPSRVKISERLVKLDKKSNNSRYKFAYSIEIPALNRNDLVHLPEALAKKLALGQLCTVLRMSKIISLADTFGQVKDLNRIDYYQHARAISIVRTEQDIQSFEVVEIQNGKLDKVVYDSQLNYGANPTQEVLLLKKNGEMVNTRTHIHNIDVGSEVAGYDLSTLHISTELTTDVVLLRKNISIDQNWRIRKLGGGYRSSADSAALLSDIHDDPKLLSRVEVYNEHEELVRSFGALQV